MSFIDWSSFSSSRNYINDLKHKQKHFTKSLENNYVSVFRDSINFKNLNNLHLSQNSSKSDLSKINDLNALLKATMSGLDMILDIINTMIGISREAAVVSKRQNDMTGYNQHLINLKEEFYNVISIYKYKNRKLFQIIDNPTTQSQDTITVLDDLVWEIPAIIIQNGLSPASSPILSLERVTLWNNCIMSYDLDISHNADYIYNNNIVILNQNKDRIMYYKNTACDLITRLSIRKKSLDNLLTNVTKRCHDIKNTNNIQTQNELNEIKNNLQNAKQLLPKVYSDNKDILPNI